MIPFPEVIFFYLRVNLRKLKKHSVIIYYIHKGWTLNKYKKFFQSLELNKVLLESFVNRHIQTILNMCLINQ